LAVFIFIAILGCQADRSQHGRVCSKGKLGSRDNLQQLVSQQAGALQEWLANEGARSLVDCEREVPKTFHILPWGRFACSWAPGSQATQERWKLIRDELFAIVGCAQMETMVTKEVLGALYAIEVRLVLQKPEEYELFFEALLSIGGPLEEENFDHAQQIAQNFSYASLYLGLAFAKKGKLRQALTQVNKCLEQNPTNIECELLKLSLLERLHMPIEKSLRHERVTNCRRAMDDVGEAPNFTYMLRGYTYFEVEDVVAWTNSRFSEDIGSNARHMISGSQKLLHTASTSSRLLRSLRQ
jgi:tetratricopeptide (TPR) repeat protein